MVPATLPVRVLPIGCTMIRTSLLFLSSAWLAGCTAIAAPPVTTGGIGFGKTTTVAAPVSTTGFFGGVHVFPYSDKLKPGRIYATTTPAKTPVFGMEVTELCWSDTGTMRTKFPDEMQMRSSKGEDRVEKTVGSNGEFSIEAIKLPRIEAGASADIVNSAKYEFTGVTEIEVQPGTADFIKAHIRDACKAVIAKQRQQGRYVFVATNVFQTESAKVSLDFKAGVKGTLKARIVEGIAPGVQASAAQKRSESREAGNRVVEVKLEGF